MSELTDSVTTQVNKLADVRKEIESFTRNPVTEEMDQMLLRRTPALVVDLESLIVYHAYPAAEDLLGYIHGDVVGREINDFIPERYHQVHGEHVERFRRSPGSRPMEGRDIGAIRVRCRDGKETPVQAGLEAQVINGKTFVLVTFMPLSSRD